MRMNIAVIWAPRRRLQRPALSFLLLLALVAGLGKPTWAHAILMQSTPAANSIVKGPDVPIWLRFNVRVDGKRSRVALVPPDGSTVALSTLQQPSPDALETHAAGLKSGTYKLQWQVLASDGHISRGEVDFTVN